MSLIFAIPSKGRLKEQVEAWLADCGLHLETVGGARGYSAALAGLPGVEVRMLSAGEIAAALSRGEAHIGVTGEDLLRETGEDMDARLAMLAALGFGRADLVVAVPASWLDVDTMSDLDEVAHLHMARTGGRMRVATKYLAQTRAFFSECGISDYRIVESGGATEGAPQAGAAELIVDITTTGATLAANGLKILSDGVILRSQARLAASLGADWSSDSLARLERLILRVEARARARKLYSLSWPAEHQSAAEAVAGQSGALVESARLDELVRNLARAGVGPVTATRPDLVFESVSDALNRLKGRLAQ